MVAASIYYLYKMNRSSKIDTGYDLIPMSDITDEAREIAKRWVGGLSEVYSIREAHKLASDIMNYAIKYGAEITPVLKSKWVDLTEREKEMITLAGEGLFYKEIANKTGTTVDNVRKHLRKVYSKLGVKNRTEALNILTLKS